MNNSSHKVLWNELRKGNEDALHELYKEFYHPLLFNGLKIYRDPELVKDCINQVFLYFWEKRSGLGIAENVGGYIFSSFKRRLLSTKQIESNYLNSEENAFVTEQLVSPSHEDFLIETQENDALKTQVMLAVEKLSKRKKELLKLHYYEGLSYDEIAEKTGLSIRTIYNKLHEAIKSLRQELAPEHPSLNIRQLVLYVLV